MHSLTLLSSIASIGTRTLGDVEGEDQGCAAHPERRAVQRNHRSNCRHRALHRSDEDAHRTQQTGAVRGSNRHRKIQLHLGQCRDILPSNPDER